MISFLIVKNELLRNLKNKKNLIITFLLPLIAIIIAVGITMFMKPSVNIGVLGEETISNSFIASIENIERVNVNKANIDTINTDMILGKYNAVVEFSNGKQEIHSLNNQMKPLIAELVNEVVNNNSTNTLEALISSMDQGLLKVAERSCGFIFITLMISTIILVVSIVNDKKNGILVRYKLSPNKASDYLIGKYLYCLISTFIQISITMLIISILNINVGISMFSFFVVTQLTGLVATSISMLIAVMCKDELQCNLVASCFGVITTLIGGTFMSIEKMPDALKFLSNISISKWLMELSGSIDSNVISFESTVIIISLIVFSILVFSISVIVGNRKITSI